MSSPAARGTAFAPVAQLPVAPERLSRKDIPPVGSKHHNGNGHQSQNHGLRESSDELAERLANCASLRDEFLIRPVQSSMLTLSIVVLGASGDLAKKVRSLDHNLHVSITTYTMSNAPMEVKIKMFPVWLGIHWGMCMVACPSHALA